MIIAVSIPLSILGSIACSRSPARRSTSLTLGGLALAVGILVDDATVTIENINWHLEQGQGRRARDHGCAPDRDTAFVSLLCICIVFVPMFFLQGVARFLFVPMALAVMFAMAWSFFPIAHAGADDVPVPAEEARRAWGRRREAAIAQPAGALPARVRRAPLRGFAGSRPARLALAHRRIFVLGFLGFVLLSFALVPFLGRNFFPAVDGGQILMHARVPVGTRVEESAVRFAAIEASIRRVIPDSEIQTLVDNIGLPPSSINLTYNNTGVVGAGRGRADRTEGRPSPDGGLRAQLRSPAAQFPPRRSRFAGRHVARS